MGRQRLTQRDTATTASSGDYIHAVIGGISKKITKANFQKELSSGFSGPLAIADTPSADGMYVATETGTYTNAGSLVTDLTTGVNFIIVSGTQTVFDLMVVAVTLVPAGSVVRDNVDAVSGDEVYSYIENEILMNQDIIEFDVVVDTKIDSSGDLDPDVGWAMAKAYVGDYIGSSITWGDCTTSQTLVNTIFYDNLGVKIGTKVQYDPADQPVTMTVPATAEHLYINIKNVADATSVYDDFSIFEGVFHYPESFITKFQGKKILSDDIVNFSEDVGLNSGGEPLGVIYHTDKQINSFGNFVTKTDWDVAEIDVYRLDGLSVTWGGSGTAHATTNTAFHDENGVIGSMAQFNTVDQPITQTVPTGARYLYLNVKNTTETATVYADFKAFQSASYFENVYVETIKGYPVNPNTVIETIPNFLNTVSDDEALVILQTGQSNYTEQADNGPIPPIDNRTYDYLYTWKHTTNEWIKYVPGATEHNMNLRLAKLLDNYQQKVYVVNHAVSGTEMDQHLNTGTVDVVFWPRVQDAINNLRASGKRPHVLALMFSQGEADSNDAGDTAAYGAKQVTWVQQWKDRLGDSLPIIMSGIYVRAGLDPDLDDDINETKMNLFHDGSIASYYHVDDMGSDDGLHRNYAGHQTEGDVLFETLRSLNRSVKIIQDLPYTF